MEHQTSLHQKYLALQPENNTLMLWLAGTKRNTIIKAMNNTLKRCPLTKRTCVTYTGPNVYTGFHLKN